MLENSQFIPLVTITVTVQMTEMLAFKIIGYRFDLSEAFVLNKQSIFFRHVDVQKRLPVQMLISIA